MEVLSDGLTCRLALRATAAAVQKVLVLSVQGKVWVIIMKNKSINAEIHVCPALGVRLYRKGATLEPWASDRHPLRQERPSHSSLLTL